MPQQTTPCQKCNSDRVIYIHAKHSDMLYASYKNRIFDGYNDIGLNNLDEDSDYLIFNYCLECGQIQGVWPCPEPTMSHSEDRTCDSCYHVFVEGETIHHDPDDEGFLLCDRCKRK